jgi:hypothetical protein
VTVPGNPEVIVKAALMTFLGADARVVRDVPDDYKRTDKPLVLVADDGGPMKWPIKSNNIIRVTAFASGPDAARAMAARCLGHVHSLSHVKKSDGTTLLKGRDPKTGADFSSFTVTAVTRTTSV